MLDKFIYTEKEQKQILDSMGILIDTREKKNAHIVDVLEHLKIPIKKKAFKQGDYSFFVPAIPELNIDREMHFEKLICIERKNSLEEYSTNLTKGRERIKNEFGMYKGDMLLLIENGTYGDIVEGRYDTDFNKRSYLSSLHSVSTEFGVPFIFIESKYSGLFIFQHMRYYLRNYIK